MCLVATVTLPSRLGMSGSCESMSLEVTLKASTWRRKPELRGLDLGRDALAAVMLGPGGSVAVSLSSCMSYFVDILIDECRNVQRTSFFLQIGVSQGRMERTQTNAQLSKRKVVALEQ
jgi:hypothetical protein